MPQPSFLAILLIVASVGSASSAESALFDVVAGDFDRQGAVVSAELPPSLGSCRRFALTCVDDGQDVPVQIDNSAARPHAVWIIHKACPAGGTLRYRLSPAVGPPPIVEDVSVDDDGRRLLVDIGGSSVLAYNYAVVSSSDPELARCTRSGYIHPVYTPAGHVVTDDLNPKDHPHHHGIWFAWRHMAFEGRSTDGWDQAAGLGRLEHEGTDTFGGGPVFGHFSVRLRHLDLTSPDGAKPVLRETWRVAVYRLNDCFVFDTKSVQTCAGRCPVVIEKCNYGGMAIRGRADWTNSAMYDYRTDAGNGRADGNHSRPRWCDLYGRVGGTTAGIAVMDHPSNFRFPQPVRLAPTLPYFCFAPSVLGPFVIDVGKPFVSQYRFCTHDGPLQPATAERLWHDFVQPPEVRLVADPSAKLCPIGGIKTNSTD